MQRQGDNLAHSLKKIKYKTSTSIKVKVKFKPWFQTG